MSKAPRRRFSDDRVRLAGAAGTLLVVLLAVSVAFTVSRYDRALTSAKRVSERRANSQVAAEAATAFWHQREGMNEFFLLPSARLLREVHTESATFDHVAAQIAATNTREAGLVAQSHAGNRAYERIFARVKHVAGTTRAQETRAVQEMNAAEDAVLTPLATLQREAAQAVVQSQHASANAASDARLAVLVTALATILLALFVASTLIVIRRLLASIRVTAEVLGVSVEELRVSSRDAAAAASEQSSAVAETSATIEELAVTARSISENARVVADA
ncbi:MAG TPA: hypothetical protein VGO39_15515, partial [Gaiellaceae bacterium]|nr:hypothetical protein [Gaiellaceae bacterium]